MTVAVVQILPAGRYNCTAGNYSQRLFFRTFESARSRKGRDPRSHEQADFGHQDVCPGSTAARLNRVGQIITAGATLGLPAFDGAATARVRRRAAPALMVLLALPFEQH